MFKPVFLNNILIGEELRTHGFIFFFGNINSSLDNLKLKYPTLTFCRLKQVHGNNLVKATEEIITADAHWTSDSNKALLIAHADCMPILVACESYCLAIHAGWRGVENEIARVATQQFLLKGPPQHSVQVFIGPHIQRESFEMDFEYGPKFQKIYSQYNRNEKIIFQGPPSKCFINLSEIVLSQLCSLNLRPEQIIISAIDTLTNNNYHSYRRDKSNSGRNLSFVARLSAD